MSEQFPRGTRVKAQYLHFADQKGTVVGGGDDYYMVCLDDGLKIESFHKDEIKIFVQPEVVRIDKLQQLIDFEGNYGLASDWHEPVGITAEVRGHSFDNAGFWGGDAAGKDYEELHVVLKHDGEPVALVNLATLFSWATCA